MILTGLLGKALLFVVLLVAGSVGLIAARVLRYILGWLSAMFVFVFIVSAGQLPWQANLMMVAFIVFYFLLTAFIEWAGRFNRDGYG